MRKRRISKTCKCGCGEIVRRTSVHFIKGHNTPEFRFWERVDKKGPDDCWEWTGAKTEYTGKKGCGHGVIMKMMATHFMMTKIMKKEIPKGLHVLHKCNNPPCVNPNHLYIGTLSTNTKQMHDEKRGPDIRGEKHYFHKLERFQVVMILNLKGVYSAPRLAEIFRVSVHNINAIHARRTWRHVDVRCD